MSKQVWMLISNLLQKQHSLDLVLAERLELAPRPPHQSHVDVARIASQKKVTQTQRRCLTLEVTWTCEKNEFQLLLNGGFESKRIEFGMAYPECLFVCFRDVRMIECTLIGCLCCKVSDHCLRVSVLVGVTYGTDNAQVMQLVKRASTEHSQIMKMPEPEVYLLDFAADAISLRQDFWIDLVVQPNRYRVMSDVRIRIEALFSEAGIVIPFQQRQIHLNTSGPLKVEVMTVASIWLNQSGNRAADN